MEVLYQGSLESLISAQGGNGLIKLDLGCGLYKAPGHIGLDNFVGVSAQEVAFGEGPDILIDLIREPLPFENESVAEIRSSHFLEHADLGQVFDESHRVLVPGGIFEHTVPYAHSDGGMFPGHSLFLTPRWFRENLHFNRLFVIDEISLIPSTDWLSLPLAIRWMVSLDFGARFLNNVAKEFTLRARKRSPNGVLP